LINAADFGVPQQRKRVFIVAIRSNFPAFKFPRATYSREVLLAAKLSNNDFYKIGNESRKHTNQLRIPFATDVKPWVTVRDALKGLPEPAETEESAILNHWKLPGARVYPCHSGSIMDLPAKTIKAGVHGTPGGENTILDDEGNFRYFTLRELARLQTFPDNYLFFGNKTQITRQIGNAVPCKLATLFFKSIKKCLEGE
jgi:DNA (cytosine-5)-methyltransferase 1